MEFGPPSSRGPSPCPQPLVQGMLHHVRLLHLRNKLLRRREFLIGDPDFRFAAAWSRWLRESQRGHHPHLFDDPTSSDPGPHILKGLRKVANIVGQLPRGSMRSQCRTFHWKKQISREPHNPNSYQLTWYNSPIACQLTTATRFPGTWLGRVMRWALIAIRSSATVLDMAACMMGDES